MLSRSLRRLVPYLCLTALAGPLAACGHAGEAARKNPKESLVIQREGKPTVSSSPGGMLQREGVRELQLALEERGIRVPVTGRYDDETRKAVLTFQKQRGLAKTSMPDLKTLAELGLDPIRLYRDQGDQSDQEDQGDQGNKGDQSS